MRREGKTNTYTAWTKGDEPSWKAKHVGAWLGTTIESGVWRWLWGLSDRSSCMPTCISGHQHTTTNAAQFDRFVAFNVQVDY